jgi:glycosyltransferase involved in cell wall biosynthesis
MERVLALKANYLANVNHDEVIIVTTSQHDREPFYHISDKVLQIDLGINYDDTMNLSLVQRISSRIRAKKLHRRKLETLLEKLRPDITVSMFTHEVQFLPDIKDGSKKVLELHFSKQFRSLDDKANHANFLIRLIRAFCDKQDRRVIKHYDKFVVLTRRDAEDWGSRFENRVVISNPTSFKPQIMADYSANNVLAMGRLCPQKGFDLLINIWNKLPDESKRNWHLHIVGAGPDKEKLENKIRQLNLIDNVSIVPPQKNVKELYSSHSVFCFSSRYEGFGLVLEEAMALGLACISFDCPCGPSDFMDDGEDGYLIPLGNEELFAEKLQALLSSASLRSRLGEKASQKIQANYTEDIIMNQWTTLFRQLLATKE